MARTKNIVIAGGGIIGLCTAYYALQKGHHVTVVDRGSPDHDCCSLGNAGMVVPSHFIPLAAPGMVAMGLRMLLNPESPFTIRPRLNRDLVDWCWRFYRAANASHVERHAPLLRDLNLASRRCFEELDDTLEDDFSLVKKGLLMLCKSEHALLAEAAVAEQARQLGVPAEMCTPEQAAKIDPGIRMEIAGAVYFPLDCHLDPQRLMTGLARALEQGGAQFLWDTEVNGWRSKGSRIDAARTSRGELTADEYVVAGGSWSPAMVRDLGLRLPLQAGKGYSLTLPAPKRLPTVCSILTEARVAVTPMGSSLRFAGTMEITGPDSPIQRRRVDGMLKAIPTYFPEYSPEDFQHASVWSGLRPCSPDGLPYIGRTARYNNLSMVTGHAMMGVSLGPITGRLMAEILSEETPSLEVSALSPDRYH